MLSGNYNGYIIAGGGANFPNGGPAVGGPKKHILMYMFLKLVKKV